MPMLTPDPTFYPSPTMAAQSPPERFAYLALINPSGTERADAIGVVDLDPSSNALRPSRRSDRHAHCGR